MRKILLILLVVAVAGAGVWWFMGKNASVPAQINESQVTHLLQGEQIGEGYYVYREDEPYYLIEAQYPPEVPLARVEARAKAQLTIEQGIVAQIEQFKQNGDFANISEEDALIQGLGVDRKYALGMEYQEYISQSHVSYKYEVYEDTLGAHPNGYFVTYVFDQEGNELGIADLFVPGSDYLERLSLLSSADITEQMKVRMQVDEVGDSFFEEGVGPQTGNFGDFIIDGDTLILFFSPYQVTAYAAGSFEVRIPLADLGDVLK